MSIKRLAGQTAIYGLSSILGRLLYVLLVPLHSRVFTTGEFGVVTDIFSFIGLAMIFMTYRFETAYFRYATDKTPEAGKAYDTALISIVSTSLLLGGMIFFAREPLAQWFKYPEYAWLIGMAAGILAFDAMAEIPLSYLRLANKPIKFAVVRLSGIVVNIAINLIFLLPPFLADKGIEVSWLSGLYDPRIGIGYIFIANLIASSVVLLLLSPYFMRRKISFDFALWKKMLVYALPLIIVGISFSINELLDRKIMIWLLPGTVEENKSILGAYGGCYKLTMILALFTQAFRYGAEPFFFQHKDATHAPVTYARVTKYYAIVALTGCLFTLLYLDIIKYILDSKFWLALGVVPILLLANLMNGLYYNVSVWYRLKDKTLTGAWIAMAGASITIVLNIWWLPIMSYWGAALATLVCYSAMVILCYRIGQKYFPVPYETGVILSYMAGATILYFLSLGISWATGWPVAVLLGINTVLFMVYIAWVYYREKEVLHPMLLSIKQKIAGRRS